MRRWGLGLLIIWVLAAGASGMPLYMGDEDAYALNPFAEILEDPGRSLCLSDVKDREFDRHHDIDHNLGFTESAYWFRVRILPSERSSAHPWWLLIHYPLLDDIRVYGVADDGSIRFAKHGGDRQPYAMREVEHPNFLFNVSLDDTPLTLYVRVVTESALQVPMELMRTEAIIRQDQVSSLFMGMYYGIFIIIIFYNGVMYGYTRERPYLYYLMFVSCFVMWQLTLNGLAIQYLWTDWPWMADHSAPFWTALSGACAILFSRAFLQTRRFLPNADILMHAAMVASLLIALLSIVLPYRTAMLMGVGMAVLVPIMLLVVGIMVWRKYFRPARFYVLGWLSFLVATAFIALNKYGLISGYYFFNYAQQVGSALEMIFLSWALADRIRLMQDEYVGKLNTLNVTLQNKVAASLEKEREKDKILMQQSRMAAMGEMIEQIAHQWRQPLNTMALVMQDLYVKLHLGKFDKEDFLKAHDQVNANLQYMSGTIDDFRNFHRSEAPQEPVAVETVIDKALSLNDASLKYSNITCSVTGDGSGNHYAGVSRSELVQVFMNLIKNARDVLVERKIAGGKIDIRIYRDGDRVKVEVEDNGGGIPPEVMARLFQPYFTTKSDSSGTGLGLYMSRAFVEENMQGRLEVENSASGACFTVTLPQVAAPAEEENHHEEVSS